MKKINKDNLRKTLYYLKKNGWRNTLLAAAERLQKGETDSYSYCEPDSRVLQHQRERQWKAPVMFSIVVPVYHTPEKYFCQMVESVLQQTYPYFELILADAGADDRLKHLAEQYGDSRIRYIKLAENAGIAENTNQGIMQSLGAYIALFDHDDLLAPDALYEMAEAAMEKKPVLIYTDEDKCDGEGKRFYDPHYKQDYNQDLLLTNNYICHFTAVRADVAKERLLRKAFDGAQDFDFVLRVTGACEPEQIVHIPKVLYHWRCHVDSTAANPESKRYAYEAGKRAVEDYIRTRGWNAEASHLKHLGFYRVDYKEDIFKIRPEIGALGGRLLDKKRKLAGGMMNENGEVAFRGLRDGYSGYVNRAALVQQAEALDIRCIRLQPACRELLEQHAGVPYREMEAGNFDWSVLPADTDYVQLSLKVSRALKDAGFVLLWDPRQREFL